MWWGLSPHIISNLNEEASEIWGCILIKCYRGHSTICDNPTALTRINWSLRKNCEISKELKVKDEASFGGAQKNNVVLISYKPQSKYFREILNTYYLLYSRESVPKSFVTNLTNKKPFRNGDSWVNASKSELHLITGWFSFISRFSSPVKHQHKDVTNLHFSLNDTVSKEQSILHFIFA